MKHRLLSTVGWFLGGMIVLAYGATAMAAPIDSRMLELDFTKPDVAQRASWTQDASLKLRPEGLTREAPRNTMLPFQLQTIEPIAIGLYLWPARSASIWATLNTNNPDSGRLFARYSPDTKHWSTWQVIDRHGPIEPTTRYMFSGELGVPQQEFGEYAELCDEYFKLPRGNLGEEHLGEEACVQWILNSQPDFFAKHLPFVGYVQFLYETNFEGGQRIEHLDILISYTVPNGSPTYDIPWRFRAQ